MQGPIQIGPLSLGDIEAASQLATAEGWNQTNADWLRLLKHQPEGCFGAYREGRLVGTVTTSIYARELAWVGMMLVDREWRGFGIGRKLMLTALEHAKREVRTVKLDATPAGRTLYETLGFVPEAGIERWEKSGASPKADLHPTRVEEAKIIEICKIDRLAFGADRAKMLELLLQQSSAEPLIVSNLDGSACGYAIARPGSRATYIGPTISTKPVQTSSLLDQMMEHFSSQAIYVDFYKCSAAASGLLSEKGFTKQRDLTRMYWGMPSRAGLSPSIFSIAGPEIG